MKYIGKDLYRLIPQRNPVVMIDEFEQVGANAARTVLNCRSDNLFILNDGTMAETGLIEHIAQSCSALAGFQALCQASQATAGDEAPAAEAAPPIGLIGEVKHFVCHRRPRFGERVDTRVSFDLTFGQTTLATGKSYVGKALIAETKLKIFMQ